MRKNYAKREGKATEIVLSNTLFGANCRKGMMSDILAFTNLEKTTCARNDVNLMELAKMVHLHP